MSELSAELREYCAQFTAAKQEADRLVIECPSELFNEAPGPDRWSVGQCLDHLNQIGTRLVPRLESAIEEGWTEGQKAEGPFRYGIFSRWFVRVQQPDSGWRMSAPTLYVPSDEPLDPETVVRSFATLQDDLIDCAKRAQGLDLRGIRVPSPVSNWLRFSLGAWLAATVAHQQRHLQQARGAVEAVQRSTENAS